MSKRKCDVLVHGPRKRARQNRESTSYNNSKSISSTALQSCYSRCLSLEEYLIDKLPASSRARRKKLTQLKLNSPSHASLLIGTVVGVGEETPIEAKLALHQELVSFTQTQRAATGSTLATQGCDTSEVITFVIWRLFQKDKTHTRRPAHLLCHGFERSTSNAPHSSPHTCFYLPGVVQNMPNFGIETLTSSLWTEIFSCLGRESEHLLLNLFLNCGIFVSLNSGHRNYHQISGDPIYQLQKSRCILSTSSETPEKPKCLSPAQITFVRNRMFYARASLNANGHVSLGLRHLHVFNRFQRLSHAEQEMRVMQYLFPRQFNLHNVFTSKVEASETAQRFKDYTVRDQEIDQHGRGYRSRIPTRLRGGVKRLVARIRQGHHSCSYTQLLNHHCAVGSSWHGPVAPAMPLNAAGGFDSLGKSPRDSGTKETAYMQETSLLKYVTPTTDVSAFCRAVISSVFPLHTFGQGEDSPANWKHILGMVDQFISSRRFESLTLQQVVDHVKVRHINWIRPTTVASGAHMSLDDRRKRLEILHEFIYFLFDSFLIPLIRTNFYVTESAVHRNRLLYFRQDIWRRMSEPGFATIRSKMFTSMNPRQFRHVLEHSRLGHSQLRLLPKEFGFRPILNLRRKPMHMIKGKRVLGPSINARLLPVFNVLNFERDRTPDRLASALFSVNDISPRLKTFCKDLHLTSGQKIFFVKMDIQSCFDSIPQEALLSVIDQVLTNTNYRMIKHVESKQTKSHQQKGLISRFVSRARLWKKESAFSPSLVEQLARQRRQTVFTATDQDRIVHPEQVRELLRHHVKSNVVRIGRRHFRQTAGIPQGSVISTLLCNLFYADFERQKLGFLQRSSSLLLRLVDDFLLITTNSDDARQFINAMSQGHGEYGISINPAKSLVNFEISVQGCKIPRLHGTLLFPYCGIGIHTETLQLSKDRLRKDFHIMNSLTVDTGFDVVGAFRRRILSALQIQMHSMLLDNDHNAREQIIQTIFGSFTETAMKMHQYLVTMPPRHRPQTHILVSVCQQMFRLTYKLVVRTNPEKRRLISQTQICWLGCAALIRVLMRKQSEYRELLRWLKLLQLRDRHRLQRTTRTLQRVVQDAALPFRDYVY